MVLESKIKEVLGLYVSSRVKILVDKSIVATYMDSPVVVTLFHKSVYRNKLRKLEFSTQAVQNVAINLSPGPLFFGETSDGFQEYHFDIPSGIQDESWLGNWTVFFSYGKESYNRFCIEIPNYFLFVEPSLDVKYSTISEAIIKIVNKDGYITLLDPNDDTPFVPSESVSISYGPVSVNLFYPDIPALGGSSYPELTYSQHVQITREDEYGMVHVEEKDLTSGARVLYSQLNPITKLEENKYEERLRVATVSVQVILNGMSGYQTCDVYQSGNLCPSDDQPDI